MADQQHILDRTLQVADEGRRRYMRDVHFRHHVQAITARVMQDHGPVDPEKADRDAYEIALRVATTMLETMYAEDGRLAQLRRETDDLRRLIEKQVSWSMLPMFMQREQTAAEVGRPTSPKSETGA